MKIIINNIDTPRRSSWLALRRLIKPFILLGVLPFFFACAQQFNYPKVSPNVPYSKVAELQTTPHTKQFSYGESPEQKILFWAGEGEQYNNTLIFIHGGCWLAQFDIAHSFALTSALAGQGFNVYSIEYRRSGNGGEWPVALQDIELALKAIKQELSFNSAYPLPVSILGHSAGGHLASLAAANIKTEMFAKVHLIGLAPIIDIVAYAGGENSCQTATPQFMGGTPLEQVKAYKDANPLELTDLLSDLSNSALNSALMMVGDRDVIVPQDMAKHPNAEFILIKEAGHFDWIHPGSEAFSQLVDKLIALSPAD